MKREVKLYNVLFPFWMLMLFPQTWLVILPGNYIIDSLVLILCMFALKTEDKKQCYKSSILKIFSFGIIADVAGSAFLLLMMIAGTDFVRMGDELYLTLPALMISAVLIFILNYFITFKKYDKKLRFKMALIFAVVTAPYTFLIPSSLLYG